MKIQTTKICLQKIGKILSLKPMTKGIYLFFEHYAISGKNSKE